MCPWTLNTYGCLTQENNTLPFAELFERGSNYTPAFYNTVSPHSDIGQVSSDDAVIHDDCLKKKTHVMQT